MEMIIMKKFYLLSVIALCICVLLSGCEKSIQFEPVVADGVEQAVFRISENDFKNGYFAECNIIDNELTGYKEIASYDNLTEYGKIYAYELHSKLKTNNPRFYLDEKIKSEQCPINEWLDYAFARQLVIVFENDGKYYNLKCLSNFDYYALSYFIYEKDEYGTSSSCPRDLLEYEVITSIFKNSGIPDLKLKSDVSSKRLLRKLIHDIECVVHPKYNIDIDKCRLYDISYDYEINCLYFKADLYTDDNRTVAENFGFSMFYFQSGKEIERLPKSL